MCGDQDGFTIVEAPDYGSSPRVRGPDNCASLGINSLRFIPACAGTRSTETAIGRRPPVHPRVCGDQLKQLGKIPLGVRFIPACAGTSIWLFTIQRAATVHPRVCGDQQKCRLWTN